MLASIDLFKALACLLIINFHSVYIYPESIKILSFGGDLGNNMFFLISGFSLLPSIKKTELSDAGRWIKKRYLRILPICTFFNIFTYFLSYRGHYGESLFGSFVFPTFYWFTGALFFFYPLLFILEKAKKRQLILIIAGILIGLHVIFDSLFAERYFMGFLALLSGFELRNYLDNNLDNKKNNKKSCPFYLASIALLVLFAVCKKLYKYHSELASLHLLIGILTIAFGICFFLSLYTHESQIKEMIIKRRILRFLVTFFSDLTLACYLSQQMVNRFLINHYQKFIFPVSFLFYLVSVLLISYTVYRIDKKTSTIIQGKIR